MKTNSGKIYRVEYTTPNMEKGVLGFETLVYASCEEHAWQIFYAANKDATIKNVEEVDDCISQHYEEKSMVPEFAVAEDMMYAMLDVLRDDKNVKIYNAEHVIDIACSMAKTAIKEAEVLYDENHPKKEEK